MAPRIKLDPVPAGFAGVITTRCEECDWEFVSIVPEENETRLAKILQHLIERHGLEMPAMTYFAH